jgi:preprotein translocase subunit SecG
MITVLWSIQIVSALLLILLVLIHSPKGDGIASIGGTSQMFSSQKNAESSLNKLTMWIAVVFFVTTFLTGFHIFG